MRSIGDVLYTYLQDVQSVLAPGIAAAFLLGRYLEKNIGQRRDVGIDNRIDNRVDPIGCERILQQ